MCLTLTHETDEPLDAEYRELIELPGPDGCNCGIPGCPGHEVIGGRIFMENHPLGTIIIECPDKDFPENPSRNDC